MVWPFLLLLLVGWVPPAHPDSLSRSRIVVRGAAVRHELRLQTVSILEVLHVDADGDGLLGPRELSDARDALAAYVARHYRLGSGGAPLTGHLLALQARRPEPGEFLARQRIDLVIEYRHDALLADLALEVTLFRESGSAHRDLCAIDWNGETTWEAVFQLSQPRRTFRPQMPPRPRGLSAWLGMGFEHIVSGWDHLAFVLGLVLAAGSGWVLFGVVTAFTLVHSLTLALAALDVVTVHPGLVEALIALSIVWVGVANLLARVPRSRWPEAFGFGLVHGLGFASFLGEALYGEPRRLLPLLGFNLGVEGGQLLVVLVVLVLLRILAVRTRRSSARPEPGSWLAPALVRRPASLVVAAAGTWWLVVRVGGWLVR